MSSIDNQDTNQAANLTDFALNALRLKLQPFAADPAGGELFMDGIAGAQLDDIKQALISGDDLLLILGPEGSGKTTLLNQLGANSGQRIQCFSVRGSDRFSTTNLFAGMLEAFKKEPPQDLKLMLDELIPCLQGMADHNTLGAVVLDDAQNIPEAELTKLLSSMLYLNSSDETLLRVTLAGPTEFEERIPELLPEGADLPYSSLAIDAFEKERTAAYLDYRLQKAGMEGDFPFTSGEVASINDEAGGRPGLLHVVAAQRLNIRDEKYVAELPPELTERKKKAAGGGFFKKLGATKLLVGALALAMIFAGLFWLKPKGNDVPDDRYKVVENKKLDTDETAEKTKEFRLPDKQKTAEKPIPNKPATQPQDDQASAANANATSTSGTQSSTSDQANSTNTEALPNANDQANSASTETSNAADNAAEAAAAAKAEAQRQAKLGSDAAKKAAADTLAEAKAAAEAAETAAQAKMAEAEAAKQQAEQEKLAAAANAAETTVQVNATNLESPNWILVQSPTLFTVQMSASKELKSVEEFLERNELEPPNSIFSFERNGATWYALVHGLYNSIEEARKDVEAMPSRARSNQPWIRAVSRIQDAMKEQ